MRAPIRRLVPFLAVPLPVVPSPAVRRPAVLCLASRFFSAHVPLDRELVLRSVPASAGPCIPRARPQAGRGRWEWVRERLPLPVREAVQAARPGVPGSVMFHAA